MQRKTNIPVLWFLGKQLWIKQRSLNPQASDSAFVVISFLCALKQFVLIGPLQQQIND
jgi:hypothetical protein